MKKAFVLASLLVAFGFAANAQITTETVKLQGVEMVETLSEDGTSMIKRPYRWFAGIGKADDKSTAVELAQLEAYAQVSRVIENVVSAQAQRGTLTVNGKVEKALKSYWEQMSMSIQKATEPFGDTKIEYNSETKMYEATSKVGIRGDRYVKILDGAKDEKPAGLNGSELKEFTEINQSIIDAAKTMN